MYEINNTGSIKRMMYCKNIILNKNNHFTKHKNKVYAYADL